MFMLPTGAGSGFVRFGRHLGDVEDENCQQQARRQFHPRGIVEPALARLQPALEYQLGSAPTGRPLASSRGLFGADVHVLSDSRQPNRLSQVILGGLLGDVPISQGGESHDAVVDTAENRGDWLRIRPQGRSRGDRQGP